MICKTWQIDRLTEDFTDHNPRPSRRCSDKHWRELAYRWNDYYFDACYNGGKSHEEALEFADTALRASVSLLTWLFIAKLLIQLLKAWLETRGRDFAIGVGLVKSIQSAPSSNDH